MARSFPPTRSSPLCWAELVTPDLGHAERFYGALFGWSQLAETTPAGVGGDSVRSQACDTASIAALDPAARARGAVPAWLPHVAVEDLDATSDRVLSLGGVIVAPAEDLDHGLRRMTIADPTGAHLALWESHATRSSPSAARSLPHHGTLCWGELATHDAPRAVAFFEALLGWVAVEQHVEGERRFELHLDGVPFAHITQMNDAWGDAPPHWMIYFGVDDVERAVDRVRTLRGAVRVPPMVLAGVGRIAVVQDAQGAYFSLLASALRP